MIDPDAPPYIAHDVRVDPARYEQDKLPAGGIAWDDLPDAPQWARHLRARTPADLKFEPSSEATDRLSGRYLWGGYAVGHFGHFIAEQSTRLLRSGLEPGDMKLLLLLPPSVKSSGPPAWLLDVLSWYGFPPERVAFVTDQPVVVEELWVHPQEEHLSWGPSGRYLDQLDQHMRARLSSSADQIPRAYVSRAGIVGGRLGGELFVEAALERAGVRVIRPEEFSLAEQLDVYARSKVLIFAEGSAVHGRQLLGRLDQRIAILVRRKGSMFAGRMIKPRCRELTYLDCVQSSVHFSFDARTGAPRRWQAFPLTSSSALVKQFQRIGIDLAPYWDETQFEVCLQADLDEWAARVSEANQSSNIDERVRLMEGSLYAVGLERYAPRLAQIARSTSG